MSEQLSESELNVLRRIVRDNTPMKIINPTASGEKPGVSIDKYLDDACKNALPMKVVDANKDAAILAAIKAAGLKLQPGEMFALQITRNEILQLSPSSLRMRVKQAQERDAEEGLKPKPSVLPPAKQKPQQRVFLTE